MEVLSLLARCASEPKPPWFSYKMSQANSISGVNAILVPCKKPG